MTFIADKVIIKTMKRGLQAYFAKIAGLNPPTLNRILRGYRNAARPVAGRLAALTATAPELWRRGGAAEARREAIVAWAELLVWRER